MKRKLDFETQLRRAFDIAATKGIRKALRHLVAMDILSETPQDIVSFLNAYQHNLGEVALGDYLGEDDVLDESHFMDRVRQAYVSGLSFGGYPVLEALRLFLTGCGFRLPGEAQKIERLMEIFAGKYMADNPPPPPPPPGLCTVAADAAATASSSGEPQSQTGFSSSSSSSFSSSSFSSADTVFILCYSIIILQTDLHKVSSASGKKRKKMTLAEFIKTNRGIDHGKDVDSKILEVFFFFFFGPYRFSPLPSDGFGWMAGWRKGFGVWGLGYCFLMPVCLPVCTACLVSCICSLFQSIYLGIKNNPIAMSGGGGTEVAAPEDALRDATGSSSLKGGKRRVSTLSSSATDNFSTLSCQVPS